MTTAPRLHPPPASDRPDQPGPAASDTGFHPPDDRFVPVRFEDLVEALASDTERFGRLREGLRAVAQAISQVIEQECNTFERELDQRYAAFNPDRDTLPPSQLGALRGDERCQEMRRHVHYLVTKANFEKLDQVQIEAAVETANSQGFQVRIRPERVQHLDLYVRGRGMVQRRGRSWRKPFRGELRDIEVFQRMVVVAQLRDNPHLLLKLYRDIPMADVEALLPHAEVLMSRADRLLLIGGGAGALSGVATKLIWFLIGGAVVASQLVWPAVLAMGTLSVRSLVGYRRARLLRDSMRSRHLYERNLASNAAVLHTLLDAIAHEEIKEALLAWVFLAAADTPVTGESDLRARIGAWLLHRFGAKVTFDASDALKSINRLDLWADRDRFRVVDAEDGLRRLIDHADQERTAGYHAQCAERTAG